MFYPSISDVHGPACRSVLDWDRVVVAELWVLFLCFKVGGWMCVTLKVP